MKTSVMAFSGVLWTIALSFSKNVTHQRQFLETFGNEIKMNLTKKYVMDSYSSNSLHYF